MIVPITADKWAATRKTLAETGERFAEMVATTPRPEAGATAHWSVADTAAHVATLSRLCAALVEPGERPLPFGSWELVRGTIIDTVADLNRELMGEFTERDPRELARLVRADIDDVLRATQDGDPAVAVPWIGDSHVPLIGLLAHLLNELQIHGRDIALASRQRWVVEPEEAALFFEMFLLGVSHYGSGRLLEGHGPIPRDRISVEFRSRYTEPRAMVLDQGAVTVEEPAGTKVDVRVRFEPVGMNLMMFGRTSQARAALTGKVAIVGGRRPWRLPAFLRIVSLPS